MLVAHLLVSDAATGSTRRLLSLGDRAGEDEAYVVDLISRNDPRLVRSTIRDDGSWRQLNEHATRTPSVPAPPGLPSDWPPGPPLPAPPPPIVLFDEAWQ